MSDDRQALLHLVSGFGLAQAVYVAAELGLADVIADRATSCEELAERTNTIPSFLRRVMRTLAAAGVCAADHRDSYRLTALGETLRSDIPGSLRSWIRLILGPESLAAWGGLVHTLQTGNIAFDHVFGTDVWSYRAGHAASASLFANAMAEIADAFYGEVLAAYPFAGFRKIIDVGGGNGAFLIALLRANPSVTGVLFELPHVARAAQEKIASSNLSARCDVVEGDAFVCVPRGGDAYVLCHVLHDWNDARAVEVLKSCRRSIAETGTLLVVERILPDCVSTDVNAQSTCVSDLRMMVMNGGCERSESEYRELYARAGFTLVSVRSSASGMHVIEGRPAPLAP